MITGVISSFQRTGWTRPPPRTDHRASNATKRQKALNTYLPTVKWRNLSDELVRAKRRSADTEHLAFLRPAIGPWRVILRSLSVGIGSRTATSSHSNNPQPVRGLV